MTPKKLNIILWTVLALLIGGIVAGLYFADGLLSSLAGDTVELKTQTEINKKRTAAYSKNASSYENQADTEKLAKVILPESLDQATVVAELAAFARYTGISTANLAFQEDPMAATTTGKSQKKTPQQLAKEKLIPKGTAVTPVTFDIAEGARYENVIRFLKMLENNQRKMLVTTINMTPNTLDGNYLDSVSLTLYLYSKAKVVEPKPTTMTEEK